MSKRAYERLDFEYRCKDRLYPDDGFSERPWEKGLRVQIAAVVAEGLRVNARWARLAADKWGVSLAEMEDHYRVVVRVDASGSAAYLDIWGPDATRRIVAVPDLVWLLSQGPEWQPVSGVATHVGLCPTCGHGGYIRPGIFYCPRCGEFPIDDGGGL